MANSDSQLVLRLPSAIRARLAKLVPLLDSDPRFTLIGGSGEARVARVALMYGIERLETELRNPGLFQPASAPKSEPKLKRKDKTP
jgi:hypothetical protein